MPLSLDAVRVEVLFHVIRFIFTSDPLNPRELEKMALGHGCNADNIGPVVTLPRAPFACETRDLGLDYLKSFRPLSSFFDLS